MLFNFDAVRKSEIDDGDPIQFQAKVVLVADNASLSRQNEKSEFSTNWWAESVQLYLKQMGQQERVGAL